MQQHLQEDLNIIKSILTTFLMESNKTSDDKRAIQELEAAQKHIKKEPRDDEKYKALKRKVKTALRRANQ